MSRSLVVAASVLGRSEKTQRLGEVLPDRFVDVMEEGGRSSCQRVVEAARDGAVRARIGLSFHVV